MQKKVIITAVLMCIGSLNTAIQAVDPYLDTNLPVNARVADLISKMTLTEKISQLGHKSPAITRLGVASYNYWNEGLHGVARSGLATSFPQSIALSSTWNPELIFRVATAISDEARVKNNLEGKGLTYWSPTINMARDPRWGRSEENYGEDPYLTSIMAVNFVKGMQGSDPRFLKTIATAKHYACNNVEKNRTGTSSDVDERSLREYYLPAFLSTIKDGRVSSIMSAYNAVNGVPSPANRTMLTNILRNEWGFDGFVVSDCDAIGNVWDPHAYVGSAMEATAISLLNGNDLNCGTTSATYAQLALDAGWISETDIDNALKRIFKARFLTGEFDPVATVPYKSIPADVLDCQKHRDLALQTARETIVLLKNENSLLPLSMTHIDTIAVIGPNANAVQLGGYSGTPRVSVSVLQGIANKLGIDISTGVTEAENYNDQYGLKTETCNEGGSNLGYIQNGDWVAYENINFSNGKSKFDIRVASGTAGGSIDILLDNPNGTLLKTVTIGATGGWQIWTTLSFDIPVTSGNHSVYLKFKGASGYLFNINWFRFFNVDDEDPLSGNGRICYAKGCDIEGPAVQSELDKAVSFAKKADVAVVVCGTDLNVADEGEDRSSLDLPGAQNQLIQAVYNANPRTILVLINGSSLSVNWANDHIQSILSAWYNGQAQGTAITEVLFGDYNPGGKLTTTWYKSISDLPAMNDYDIKNNRSYLYFQGIPLYPFGHGLSYTRFSYSNLVIASPSLNMGDSVAISVDVTNSGQVTGDEVVQLYTHVQSIVKRPLKELKAFKRITLLPSETKTVTFYLAHHAMKFYDETTRSFKVENGIVDILAGSSSEDIRLQGQIATSEAIVSGTYRQDPFIPFQAEHLEGKTSSVSFQPVSGCNLCANMSGNDSYIVVKNFDFSSSANQFNVQLSSTDLNNSIQIVLDKVNGEVAGTLNVVPTNDLNTFTLQTCKVNGIWGIRDIYLVLKGSSGSMCKIDWFAFQSQPTNIQEVMTPEKQTGFQCKIHPNPSRSDFSLHFNLPDRSDVEIELIDLQGTVLKSVRLPKQSAGIHQYRMNTTSENLSQGLYMVHIKAGFFHQSKLISIQK